MSDDCDFIILQQCLDILKRDPLDASPRHRSSLIVDQHPKFDYGFLPQGGILTSFSFFKFNGDDAACCYATPIG